MVLYKEIGVTELKDGVRICTENS